MTTFATRFVRSVCIAGLGVALVSAAAARVACAHGAPPALTSVAFAAAGGADIAVATTFGVLVTASGGQRWELVCEEAIGYRSGVLAQVALLPGGGLVVQSPEGVAVSRDDGCSFEAVPGFVDRAPSALAQSAADARVLYVTTAKRNVANTLFRSVDAGETFVPTALSHDMLQSGVAVAPSRPQRVYVTAWREESSPALFRSDDGGATWAEHAHPVLRPFDDKVSLLGVSPADPDVLFTRTFAGDAHNVWRTDDGGRTFARVLDTPELPTGIAIAADGDHVWLATGSGIHSSGDGGRTFAPPPALAISTCVGHRGGVLFACGAPSTDGWAFAKAISAGSWQALLTGYDAIASVRRCAQDAPTTRLCAEPWRALAVQYGFGSAVADGGAAVMPVTPALLDAGATPIDAGGSRRARETGCSFAPGRADAPFSFMALLLSLFACGRCGLCGAKRSRRR